MKPVKSSSLTKNAKGAAGVHLVVAQLSLKGYVALPTTRNLQSVDLVAFDGSLSRFAFIQVKSTDKPAGGWVVHTPRKSEGWEQDLQNKISLGKRFFYVFVALPHGTNRDPAYYIVPSQEVADMLIIHLKQWLVAHPNCVAAKQPIPWGKWKGEPPVDVRKKYQDKWARLFK